jgi:hypothetical protein
MKFSFQLALRLACFLFVRGVVMVDCADAGDLIVIVIVLVPVA